MNEETVTGINDAPRDGSGANTSRGRSGRSWRDTLFTPENRDDLTIAAVEDTRLGRNEIVEGSQPVVAREALPADINAVADAGLAQPVPLHFDIFTLFPDMFGGPFAESIIRRALDRGLLRVALHNIRDFTTDRHHVCDDTPYGGGGGMVMKPEPIVRAIETVLTRAAGWSLPPADVYVNLPPWQPDEPADLPDDVPIILLAPTGRVFSQAIAAELAQHRRIALLCGRYEGIDERVRSQVITDEISIGDYVLSGGELAAMVLVDAITRLLPGALGFELGAHQDSHSPGMTGLLEGPQYTRPLDFRGESVPEILYSGHHANVAQWRRQQGLLRTLARRPDILRRPEVLAALGKKEIAFLRQQGWQD